VNTLERTALLEVPAAVAYDVVTNVTQYPDFLPGCEAVRVLQTTETGLVAEVAVVGAGLHESFVTENQHTPGEAVLMSLREGPFDRLEGQWVFTALGDMGCRVDLRIDYQPRGLLARLLSGLADRIANRLVDAFVARIVEQHQHQTSSGQVAP
jgi:ribosome-associated toxin RatA of RatAB toxin-antitoxin module